VRYYFLSDNYFYCGGLNNEKISSIFISRMMDVDLFITKLHPKDHVVVYFDSDAFLSYFLTRAKSVTLSFILLLKDIKKNSAFRINNVLFSSFYNSEWYLTNKLDVFGYVGKPKLTKREIDMLNVYHLKNKDMADCLNISHKTCSGHRNNIKRKFNLRLKNSLALVRIMQVVTQI